MKSPIDTAKVISAAMHEFGENRVRISEKTIKAYAEMEYEVMHPSFMVSLIAELGIMGILMGPLPVGGYGATYTRVLGAAKMLKCSI